MKVTKLSDMKAGWFVGNFQPSSYATDVAEIAVQTYHGGERKPFHHHKLSTELTLILTGEVEMSGQRFCSGDIIQIDPGESTDFFAISDATTVVVKIPSIAGDKYLDE